MRVRCDSMHTLSSFADAKYEWETTKPWRGDTSGEKLLDGRAKHHMTIRIGNEGEVRCKLYRTDVVTYHADGVIELEPYNTGSTNEFANTLLPSGVRVDFVKGVVMLNCSSYWEPGKDTRIYRCYDNFRIRKVDDLWALAEGQEILPWERPTVDREKAKVALKKYNFSRLQAWVIGYDAMNGGKVTDGYDVSRLGEYELTEFMEAGPTEWLSAKWRTKASAGWGRDRDTTTISPQIEHIRELIYRRENVVHLAKVDYLTSPKEMLNFLSRQKKYRWV